MAEPEREEADQYGADQLAAKDDTGGGILVDAKNNGRPIGDTNSSAVYLEELPLNFHGGDEALHFALGELFGKFGKIKKIDLYMEDGKLGTKDFTGNAIVVFHRSKQTGSRDKGDSVYEACSTCDGKFHLLGWKHWRIKCEAAVWQREGYDVKDKEKVLPCVELTNLWEYDTEKPIGYYIGMQTVIRDHAAITCEQPFCKVDPMSGEALVWFKKGQDAIKFASQMHKSFFMGRKVGASLCRRARPKTEEWNGIKDFDNKKANKKVDAIVDKARAAGTFTLFPDMAKLTPAPPVHNEGEGMPMDMSTAFTTAFEEDIAAEATTEGEAEAPKPKPLPFRLKVGTRVALQGLEAKPENNGKKGDVIKWLSDIQKYQVQLDFGSKVKVKMENLEILEELSSKEQMFLCEHKAAEREDKTEDALKAHLAAKRMANSAPKAIADASEVDFQATVCVDPSLLKRSAEAEAILADEEEKAAEARRRQRSRSRSRIMRERVEAAKARLAADGAPRSKWIMPSPEEQAAEAAKLAGAAVGASEVPKEPEESREEMMKMSISKLKELLTQFGKHGRGCLEKRDFVDRLKPAPKA